MLRHYYIKKKLKKVKTKCNLEKNHGGKITLKNTFIEKSLKSNNILRGK